MSIAIVPISNLPTLLSPRILFSLFPRLYKLAKIGIISRKCQDGSLTIGLMSSPSDRMSVCPSQICSLKRNTINVKLRYVHSLYSLYCSSSCMSFCSSAVNSLSIHNISIILLLCHSHFCTEYLCALMPRESSEICQLIGSKMWMAWTMIILVSRHVFLDSGWTSLVHKKT